MNSYNLNKLPKREVSGVELFLKKIGAPLAIIAFIYLYFFSDFSFLNNIDPETLRGRASLVYNEVGPEIFRSMNIGMMAVFVGAIILWMTAAVPNYLTSLILILTIVLTHVLPEVDAYHQLGHKVMWLNILSFILASMLVKTSLAKRFALAFILKFGKKSSSIFISFIVINLVLSAFISATTAKAAILLPIFMVVAAVYGATGGKDKNNFGRNIVLQNLLQINLAAGAFVTGSGANLLAAALIGGAIGSDVFFMDWMKVAFPLATALMILGYFVGVKWIFRLKPNEKSPQIEGGLDGLRKELTDMGKLGIEEYKAIFIFSAVLILWATDRYHGISATSVAFLGAIVALLPRIGIIKWNDVDIPWHLLLFSAGAYTLGAGFKATGLPSISVNATFDYFNLGDGTPFWLLYVILTGMMIFSALVFQSKTMRTLIFIPIAIGVANRFGYPVISLALPVAFLIEHVYVLPFNSKPAALLYETNQYSYSDTFKYGFTMMFLSWIVTLIMAETWYKYWDITPNGLGIF
jgi:anion transporter